MWISVAVLVISLSAIFLLALIHYTTNGRKYWQFRKVPYREPCPIFGNFGPTFTMRKSYAKMLQYFYDTYRDNKYVGMFQARRPTLMVIDLDIVKNIYTRDFNYFGDRISVSTDIQREPLLRNIANMSGTEWKAMRQVVSPTFSSAKMKAMFPLVVDCAHNLSKVLLQQPTEGVDISKIMNRFTTDIIGSCAFGVDPGSLENPESPFLKMVQKMFKQTRFALLKRYCRTFSPWLFKFLNLRSYPSDVEIFFTNTIRQVLEERRESGKVRHDFLQLMMNVQKTETEFPMTDELIISNSFIFMLAGQETSAITFSFCLYQLAKDQELQDKLRTEIKECMARHGGLNYESVSAMRLVNQTVLETLRLHPPVPLTTRLCTAPCNLPGTDLELRVKDALVIPIYCIQNDGQHFVNPHNFDPERFNKDNNPPGFMVFGDGPRKCPGARFGPMMVVAGLAAMLTTSSVEPCAQTTSNITYDTRSVLLKNKGGIWLKFTPYTQ